MNVSFIGIEIVKGDASAPATINLRLPAGATVADALQAVAVSLGIEDIKEWAEQVGVFGQRCNLQRGLCDGDRIELYRPLLLDAKAARRLRAKSAGAR